MGRCIIFIFIAAVLAASISSAARAEQVYCYDEGRKVLSVVGRDACGHRIIPEDQAKAIQQKRRAYIRRSVESGDPTPSTAVPSSYGSGFFVDASGYVITNHHVTSQCQTISVLTRDGTSIAAALFASSAREDLALLKTRGPQKDFATLRTSIPVAGEAIDVAGFPVLKLPRRQPMAVSGTFLGERPVGNGGTILTLDILVWQGSSGSPVIDRYGAVVGVIFAKANIPVIYQKTGETPDDRAYAMPSRVVSAFLKRYNIVPRNPVSGEKPPPPVDYLVRVDCFR